MARTFLCLLCTFCELLDLRLREIAVTSGSRSSEVSMKGICLSQCHLQIHIVISIENILLFNSYWYKLLGHIVLGSCLPKWSSLWNGHRVAWANEMTHGLYVGSCISLSIDLAFDFRNSLFHSLCGEKRKQSPLAAARCSSSACLFSFAFS